VVAAPVACMVVSAVRRRGERDGSVRRTEESEEKEVLL
jgi:hypothetical protein